MPDRSWFYASNGQQQGPFPEAQLRDLITRGTVRADTLVWSEGMSGWQRAGDVPGLVPGGSGPPPVQQPGGPPPMGAGGYGSEYAGGALSFDFGILEFVWRSIVTAICGCLILPAPWVTLWYLKWLVPCVKVPGRPNLTFNGGATIFAIAYFGFIVLVIAVQFIGNEWLNNIVWFAELVLFWLFLKWFIANLASNGQPLGLSFDGAIWSYVGWNIFLALSIFTIIGWAWVTVAWARWVCRHIQGTHREVLFIGTGLEFLWRALVAAIACMFIIPIPWVYRWMLQWWASQTVLVERSAPANV
jgi:GYF domain 2